MSIVRKRYLRSLPTRDSDFVDETITPDMVGRKVSECRRLRPVGRGKPCGMIGYVVEGDKLKFAYSLQHPNDEFNKRIAHKMIEARLQNPKNTRTISLTDVSELHSVLAEREPVTASRKMQFDNQSFSYQEVIHKPWLPDPLVNLLLTIYEYENNRLMSPKLVGRTA